MQNKEHALKLDASDFACRSKPKQNHKDENLPALPQEPYLLGTELGPMLNQENIQSPIMRCRRRRKEKLQKHLLHCHHWSDDKWKKSMAGGGGNKKRYQYCTDSSGTILYFRATQGHSGRNLTDPTLHDNVLIPSNFFQYICHVGCAINLLSIINSGMIPGGQILNNRQTVFFLPVDPWTNTKRILIRST